MSIKMCICISVNSALAQRRLHHVLYPICTGVSKGEPEGAMPPVIPKVRYMVGSSL